MKLEMEAVEDDDEVSSEETKCLRVASWAGVEEEEVVVAAAAAAAVVVILVLTAVRNSELRFLALEAGIALETSGVTLLSVSYFYHLIYLLFFSFFLFSFFFEKPIIYLFILS
ncbi:hypothetical protein ACB098_06G045300 [Castanea mollissima]